jgi:DNA-binding HxlR family transcriptional regulator
VDRVIIGKIMYHILRGAETFSEIEKQSRLSPSTLSKYLAIMRREGLLAVQSEGGRKTYFIPSIESATEYLLAFTEKEIKSAKDAAETLKGIREINSDLWKDTLKKLDREFVLRLVGGGDALEQED